MVLVRFLQGGELEMKNQYGVHVKPITEGATYKVEKVIYAHTKSSADIYFEGEGCAEDVPATMIELHGDVGEAQVKKPVKENS